HPRSPGAGGRGQPRPSRDRGRLRRPGRPADRADGDRRLGAGRAGGRRATGLRAAVEPADRVVRHRGAGRDVLSGGCARMTVRIGVVVFPGSNRDIDAVNALEVAGAEPVVLWHEQASLDGVAGVLVPGGFAYGDYLRAGVIARFSPIVRAVSAFAEDGG